jgi:hypothetical protein
MTGDVQRRKGAVKAITDYEIRSKCGSLEKKIPPHAAGNNDNSAFIY